MKKDRLNIKVTELFIAQVSRDERYYGNITRTRDENGEPICRGKIKIRGGYIFAEGRDQDELGERLDDLAKLVVKQNIHDNKGRTERVAEKNLFLN
jgi:hypothetical protein